MKLYYSKGACSLAVRILINEMQLQCEYEAVDLKTKKTEHGKDFLKINPKGAVPTLEISTGKILTENSVIQQYLADTYEAVELLPGLGNFKRYHVLEWLNFVATDLHKSFAPIFNQSVPAELKTEIFFPLIVKKFGYVNAQLANNEFICGDGFTLPDGYLFVMLSWANAFKIDLTAMPHLTRYLKELVERPSIKKSLEEEAT